VESFRGGPNPFEQLTGAPARLMRQPGEIVLRMTAPDIPLRVTTGSYDHVAVQARFAMNSGIVRVEARQTDVGSYAVQLGMDGQVLLLRNNVSIASAVVAPSAPGQWRTLRLSVIGAALRVAIDGVEVVGMSDAEPLIGGAIRFMGIGVDGGGLLVDDIVLTTYTLIAGMQAMTMGGEMSAMGEMEMSAMSVMSPQPYSLSPEDAVYFVDQNNPYTPTNWVPNYRIHRLTAGNAPQFIANGTSPIASQDGRKLMYSCDLGLGYQVCLSDYLGNNNQLLPVAPEHVNNFNYVGGFSPDGEWALYITDTGIEFEPWVVHLVTGERIRFMPPPASPNPLVGWAGWSWEPDGNIYAIRPQSTTLLRIQFDEMNPGNSVMTVIALPSMQIPNYLCFTFYGYSVTENGDILIDAPCQPTCYGCEYFFGFDNFIILYQQPNWSQVSYALVASSVVGVPIQPIHNSQTLFATWQQGPGLVVVDTQTGISQQLQTSLSTVGDFYWSVQPTPTTSDCAGATERFVFVTTDTPTQSRELRDVVNAGCSPMQFNAPAYAPDYSFSRDQLAFINGSGSGFARDVMIADGAAGNAIGLGLPGNANNPAWSPDGNLIAFDYRVTPNDWRYVYIAEPNGANMRQLNGNVGSMPTWSGNGYWVAYINSSGNLSVVNFDCGIPYESCYDFTLHDAPGRLSAPAWSPDGRTIVVVEHPSAGQPNYRLLQLTMNRSGERGQTMYAGGYAGVVSSTVVFTQPNYLGNPAWATNSQALLIEMKDSRLAPTYIERLVRTGAASWVATGLGGGKVFGKDPVNVMLQQVISENVPFTNLRLLSTHSMLQSVMFWAIYNETSEDRAFYGGDPLLQPTLPPNQDLPQRIIRDTQGVNGARFLVDDPFCTDQRMNSAEDELVGSNSNWDSDILRLEHCVDHRYMAASVLLNAMLSYERRVSHTPASPSSIMSAAYGYFPQNFAGTFGIGAANSGLWSDTGFTECVGAGFILGVPAQLPMSSDPQSNDPAKLVAYSNIRSIAIANGEILRNLVERSDANRDLETLRNDNIDDAQQQDAIQALQTRVDEANRQLGLLPRREVIQNQAIEWMHAYLQCQLASSNPTNRVKMAFERINPQINQAISDLYNEMPDLTGGAFSRKTPNVTLQEQRTDIALFIPGMIDNMTPMVIESFYSNQQLDDLPCNSRDDVLGYERPTSALAYQYVDILQSCLSPQNPTIVQPLLMLDIGSSADSFAGYVWSGAIYQIEPSSGPIDRYGIDVCAQLGLCLSNP
jgi:Tol biopolymer transport system component